MDDIRHEGEPTARHGLAARMRAIGIAVLESYFRGLEYRYIPQARAFGGARLPTASDDDDGRLPTRAAVD